MIKPGDWVVWSYIRNGELYIDSSSSAYITPGKRYLVLRIEVDYIFITCDNGSVNGWREACFKVVPHNFGSWYKQSTVKL